MRTAKISDFEKGTELFTKEGYRFTLQNKYMENVWEAKEGKLIFENEAEHYKVKQ